MLIYFAVWNKFISQKLIFVKINAGFKVKSKTCSQSREFRRRC